MTTWEEPRPPGRHRALVVVLAVTVAVVVAAVGDRSSPATPTPTAAPTDDRPAWRTARSGLWAAMPPAPVVPRIGHAVAGAGDRVVVWGGFDVRGRPLDDGAVFDTVAGTWAPVPSGGSGAADAQVVWQGDRIVTVSRFVTREYDTVEGVWRDAPAPPLTGSDALEGLSTAGATVVARTHTVVGPATGRADLLVWRPDDPRWSRLPPPPFELTDVAAVATTGTTLVVASPDAGGTRIVAAEVDADRRGAAWRRTARVPAPGRAVDRVTAVAVDRQVVLVGATSEGEAVYVAVRDPSGTWERTTAPPASVTRGGDLVATAHAAVLWDRRTATGATLDPGTGRWRRIPTAPGADGAARPAVGAGDDVVTWGGLSPIGAALRLP